ncbi:MAG: serine O-acetyltransferase [Gemmataceae bacterium]
MTDTTIEYRNDRPSMARQTGEMTSDGVIDYTRQQQDIQDFTDAAMEYIIQGLLVRRNGAQYRNTKLARELYDRLVDLLYPFGNRYSMDIPGLAVTFVWHELPEVIKTCEIDAARYMEEDPAMEFAEEVYFGCIGFLATVAHRIANALSRLKAPVIPRAIACYSQSKTGIDIHPATTIGEGLFIDHGTGVAIGCTAVLGRNVNIYKGVVLGTRSKPRKQTEETTGQLKKRHPTISDNVSLYTNAFVGGDIVVGEGAVIGAYAFVTDDVPPGEVVLPIEIEMQREVMGKR